MNNWKSVPALLMVLVIIGGCSTIKPDEPVHIVNSTAPPAVDDSTVQIPLTMQFAPVQVYINNAVPGEEQAEGAWGDIGNGWFNKHYWVRDPIILSASGGELHANTKVNYRIAISHLVHHIHVTLGSCGYDKHLDVEAGLAAKLTPKPDWSIKPDMYVASLQPGGHCQVAVINLDVTNKVLEFFNNALNSRLGQIQGYMEPYLKFHDKADEAWGKLEQPFDVGNGVYFTLNPEGAAVGDVESVSGGIQVVAGITAKPLVQVGNSGTPPPVVTSPLPPLKTGKVIPEMHIELPITVTYDALSQAVNSRLAGHLYPMGKYKETIDSVAVYGSGDVLVLQIKLSGDADGTLYLTGTPIYNAASEIIYIDSLDYTVSTHNAIVKVADWLLHTDFQKTLQAEAYYDISKDVSILHDKAQQAINRSLSPHADLSGTITDIKPLGFVLKPGSVTAYLVGDGQASIAFH